MNNSGQLTRTYAGTSKILASEISLLQFSRPATSMDLLDIDITASNTSEVGRALQQSAHLTVKMRN